MLHNIYLYTFFFSYYVFRVLANINIDRKFNEANQTGLERAGSKFTVQYFLRMCAKSCVRI